jgi:GDP/UDP-N,N'-diacetylbacillosamine 2-epimerase (hydrolysing)
MQGIKDDSNLSLQLIVTGSHLSPEFGLTYRDIERDGFSIDKRVEILTSSDTTVGISTSVGLGLVRFADAFDDLKPSLVLILGDRFEIFSAASAAMIARIPIAHLHGGETTEGAIDEAIRHSITKMAHLHFVAAKEYYNRVIQLGEQPDSVFLVGGLGVDNIKRIKLLSRIELEESLGIRLNKRNLLITFHPVTLETSTASDQMAELLQSLSELTDTELVFTMPNADTDGRVLIEMVENYCKDRANAHCFTSLGQLRYFSAIAQFDGIVGNSSSGLAEVPSFKKGTINIGDRQSGRLKATSVIDCEPNRESITSAICKLYSSNFQSVLEKTVNPYGEGGATEQIISKLKSQPLENCLKKRFFNLQFNT